MQHLQRHRPDGRRRAWAAAPALRLRTGLLKSVLRILPAVLLSVFLLSTAFATEIRVYRLNYARPESVAAVCTSIFGGQGTFVASPNINALVVNTDDKELFREIEKLVAALDRKPATLRFSVQSLGESNETQHRLKTGSGHGSGFNTTSTQSSRSSQRSVLALEFAKAAFTDDQIRIYSFPGWYGDETHVLTISHGLKVSGHVTEAGRIMVQVWYAEDSGSDTEQLLTELEVEPGQWVEFGGLAQSGADRSRSVAIDKDGSLSLKKGRAQTDRRFSLRVDMIR